MYVCVYIYVCMYEACLPLSCRLARVIHPTWRRAGTSANGRSAARVKLQRSRSHTTRSCLKLWALWQRASIGWHCRSERGSPYRRGGLLL